MKSVLFSLIIMLTFSCIQSPKLKAKEPQVFPITMVEYGKIHQVNEKDVLTLLTENPDLVIGDRPYCIWVRMQKCSFYSNKDTLVLDFGETVFKTKFKVLVVEDKIVDVDYKLVSDTIPSYAILYQEISEMALKMDTLKALDGMIKIDLLFKVYFEKVLAGQVMTPYHKVYGCCICNRQ